MSTTTKDFPVAAVGGVCTGICLNSFSGIHEVMDHLYPGIMTIGCAAMMTRARDELYRQHPKLREFVRVNGIPEGAEQAATFRQLLRMHFGETLSTEGPVEVSEAEARQAFEELRK